MENFRLHLALLILLVAFCGFSRANAPLPGLDVGSQQRNVDWKTAYSKGARFAYIKATEDTSYRNFFFSQQYNGACNEKLIRGAYHFARPDLAGAVAQADYFVLHGGRWSKDGKTLPGAVQLGACVRKRNCPASPCYGLNPTQMAAWISAFVERYRALTGIYPVIHTDIQWYKQCVKVVGDFSRKCPLWLTCYGCGSKIELPYAWPSYAFLQTSSTGTFPGNQDVFNGDLGHLLKFATAS